MLTNSIFASWHIPKVKHFWNKIWEVKWWWRWRWHWGSEEWVLQLHVFDTAIWYHCDLTTMKLYCSHSLNSMFVSLCRNKDCLRVWKLFEQAFLYKDPCSMTKEDYQPLMDLARYSIPCNKVCCASRFPEKGLHLGFPVCYDFRKIY